MNRAEFFEKLMESYTANYDIERLDPDQQPVPELPLVAKASMHVSESGFILTRKAQMWSTNSDEHVFFYSADTMTDELCEKGIMYAYDEGMKLIDVDNTPNHMCTCLVAIFICNNADEDAISRIRKCRLYKSFQMSLKGWMEFHAVCVNLDDAQAISNRYGKDTAKFINELLHPKNKKKRSTLSIIRKMLD